MFFTGRWRQLITTDSTLQTHVMKARSLDDLKAICELADYRLFFSRQKWLQIMECVQEGRQREQQQQQADAAVRLGGTLGKRVSIYSSFGRTFGY